MSDFPIYGAGIEVFNYGTDLATSRGTEVVSSASTNTKGSWVEIVATTGVEINGFSLDLGTDLALVNYVDILLDIAVGGAGSEEVVVSNMLFSISVGLDFDYLKKVEIPLNIPSGSRISARIQASIGSMSVDVTLVATPSFFTGNVGLSEVISVGENTGDSGGISVDPGGTVNTKGSWVEITSSLSVDIKGVFISQGQQQNANNRVQRCVFDVGIGGSGSEEIIIPNFPFVIAQTESVGGMVAFLPIAIPSGTRVAIRSQSTSNNSPDRLIDYVLYGVR